MPRHAPEPPDRTAQHLARWPDARMAAAAVDRRRQTAATARSGVPPNVLAGAPWRTGRRSK